MSVDELQAYVDITWTIVDLVTPNYAGDKTERRPTLYEAICEAIHVVEEEDTIPDVETRLLTMFNLVRPKEIEYEYAQYVYIAEREPVENESIEINLSDAFILSAGFCNIKEMKWPKQGWTQWYKVLLDRENKELYLAPSPPKPKSEKPKSGALSAGPRVSEPLGAPEDFIKGVLERTSLSGDPKCTFHTVGCSMTEFVITPNGELVYWEGNVFRALTRSVSGGSAGASKYVGGKLQFARREKATSPARANDIEKYLDEEQYPMFWKWFHIKALRGDIYAAPDNSDRNSWFFKKISEAAEQEELRKGISLNEPVKLRTLTRFLGGAYWADYEETKMSFPAIYDCKFLVGYLRRGPYLELSWKRDAEQRFWPTYEEVRGNLEIGERSGWNEGE